MMGRRSKAASTLIVAKFRSRDQRVDEILKDGPRYVEEARERAKKQIADELRRKQARHQVA